MCRIREGKWERREKVIIKIDQETSIDYPVKDIIQERQEGRTIPENSPVKSSGSNEG